MKCYKVTDHGNRSFIIAPLRHEIGTSSTYDSNTNTNTVPDKYSLQYALNKVTHGIKGSLGVFCFKTLEDAKAYLRTTHSRSYKIYECEGYNEVELPRSILRGCIDESGLNMFYNKKIPHNKRSLYIPLMSPRESFICFESIKLLKEVT